MFSAKVREKSKNITFKVAVAIFTFLFIVILGPGLLDLDSSQALAKGSWGKNRGGCKTIALDARIACSAEVNDDYWIAIGKCNNIAESDERADCKQDAWTERKEALEECGDQLEARRDLCEALGEKYYNPDIKSLGWIAPDKITASDNPYFPLVPGYKWTYKTKEDGVVTETITVEVLKDKSIEIEGVPCVVVRDIVYEGNDTDPENIKEDTLDWYGQQDDGTVWYFGEFSLSKVDCEDEDDPEGELCEGLFSEDGSWKSGYNGDKAGIIMFGDPALEVETTYRQELSLGNAEDAGKVLSFNNDSVTVPAGTFSINVVKTLDFTPLDPATENKYHAPGVGTVLEEGLDEDGVPTGERVELISGPTTP